MHYTVFGADTQPFAPPNSVDFVLSSRELHNWIAGGYLDRGFAQAFAALKPGGVLAIEEHRADPKPQVKDAANGYTSTDVAVAAATKAGFKLDGASEINANPKDTKDYPFGVWTLPPTRQSTADGKTVNPAFESHPLRRHRRERPHDASLPQARLSMGSSGFSRLGFGLAAGERLCGGWRPEPSPLTASQIRR